MDPEVIWFDPEQPKAVTRMWTARLCHGDDGFCADLECAADDLLTAAQKLSVGVVSPYYLTDLCCRGVS